jgi:hypothetical protein
LTLKPTGSQVQGRGGIDQTTQLAMRLDDQFITDIVIQPAAPCAAWFLTSTGTWCQLVRYTPAMPAIRRPARAKKSSSRGCPRAGDGLAAQGA